MPPLNEKLSAARDVPHSDRSPMTVSHIPTTASTGSAPQPAAERVLVVVATYQERENIARLLPAILAADAQLDVLVVDDDSPDGTGAVVDALAVNEPRVSLLTRHGCRGLGAAVLAGLGEGRRRGYVLAVNLDADFSHAPADIPRLLAAVAPPQGVPVDVVIGSRKIAGGNVVGWPLSRHLFSWLVCWWTRWVLWVPVRDGSSGFRVIRLARLETVKSPSEGYAFFEEMLWQIHRSGGTIREVPITFTERRRGQSKVDWRQMLKGSADLLRLGWATWTGKGTHR